MRYACGTERDPTVPTLCRANEWHPQTSGRVTISARMSRWHHLVTVRRGSGSGGENRKITAPIRLVIRNTNLIVSVGYLILNPTDRNGGRMSQGFRNNFTYLDFDSRMLLSNPGFVFSRISRSRNACWRITCFTAPIETPFPSCLKL